MPLPNSSISASPRMVKPSPVRSATGRQRRRRKRLLALRRVTKRAPASSSADPPVVAAIGFVEDVGAAGLGRHLPADLDVVDVGIGDGDVARIVGQRVIDDVQFQADDATVAAGPVDQPAQRDRRRIDQPHHLAALAADQPIGQPREHGEGLAEDRQRAAAVGIGQRRTSQLADPQMIVMVGIGVPRRLQPAKAAGAAELGIDQRHQMIPAAERLVVGIAAMAIHNRVEPPTSDRLEKIAKDAIAVAHARSFLSLDNQKVAGSACYAGHAPRVIVNCSPDSPAVTGGGGPKGREGSEVDEFTKSGLAAAAPSA